MSYVNQEESEPIHKVSFINKENPVTTINRIEDIDAWGKQHGCTFVFIKDWAKKEIYTAIGFADSKGSKNKRISKFETDKKNTWEKALVRAANEYKDSCPSKLRTITLQWSSTQRKFYVGDPNIKPKVEGTWFNF